MSHLNKLVAVANKLDTTGLYSLASSMDEVIERIAVDEATLNKQYDEAVRVLNQEKAKGQSTPELQRAQEEVTKLHKQIQQGSGRLALQAPEEEALQEHLKKLQRKKRIHEEGALKKTLDTRIQEHLKKLQLKKRRGPDMRDAIKEFNRLVRIIKRPEIAISSYNWKELDDKVKKHFGLFAGRDYNNWSQMINAMRMNIYKPRMVEKKPTTMDPKEEMQRRIQREVETGKLEPKPFMEEVERLFESEIETGKGPPMSARVRKTVQTMALNLGKLDDDERDRMIETGLRGAYGLVRKQGYEGSMVDFTRELVRTTKQVSEGETFEWQPPPRRR